MNYEGLIVAPAAVEIYLLAGTCLLLLLDVFIPQTKRILTHFAAIGILLGGAWLAWPAKDSIPIAALNGFYLYSPLASVMKAAVLVLVAACFAYSRAHYSQRGIMKGEIYSLGLLASLGMMVIISANNLLVLYLGIEILALSQYALIALRRDSVRATEAALKYFVLGALSSGLMLYGMSLIYGVTGHLGLQEVSAALLDVAVGDVHMRALLYAGVAFLVASIAFKLGAAPFHVWLPDVYQGAPMSMTLFISVAPKVAALMFAVRLLEGSLSVVVEQWVPLLIPVIILSLAIGNIVAIAQTSIKRMLAYSAIAHMGYLLLGLLAGDSEGYVATLFYILSYAVMTVCAFGMLTLLSTGRKDIEDIDDLKGLWKKDGYSAMIIMVLMISMAGIPPTVGFFAKLQVLQAAVQGGFLWLAVLAVIFSVIGAYYYLRVIRVMIFENPPHGETAAVTHSGKILATANVALVLGLGIFPSPVFALLQEYVWSFL